MKKNWLTGRVTGFDPIPRLAHIFALALALFIAPGAWADITKANPVTGKSETYDYQYVGSGTWTASEWENANGEPPTAAPGTDNSGLWGPMLVDKAASISVTKLNGWELQLGVFGGANVTVGQLGFWTGNIPCFGAVDDASHLTISATTGNNWNNTVKFYVANSGGITFTSAFAPANPNGTGNIHYYLKGSGSVAYSSTLGGAVGHVIKQADVTLSGTTRVASKTLVSFASSTKTFTAAADVNIYATDGATLKKVVGVTTVRASNAAIADTVSELRTSDTVGACEIVQCTDGVVLYYVDGDPSAIAAYKPSININFTNGSGNGLTTSADVGLDGYAVPGTSWNNFEVANDTSTQTFGTVAAINSTGAASTAVDVSVTVSNQRGRHQCSSLTPATDPRHGYIDEGSATATPTVTITGIPYDHYRVIVYHATDQANAQFGYDTINGVNFTYVDGVQQKGTASWGASGALNSAEAIAEGVNTLVSSVMSGDTVTMVAHRIGGGSPTARGCFAAIQVVEYVPEVGENDLEIEVDGATSYSVDEGKTLSGTVYLTGSGTLTLVGSEKITAAAIDVGKDVVLNIDAARLDATTFTGSGTVVYDGAAPVAGNGWADIGWSGTVWVKNQEVSDFNGNNYGNGGSTIRFTGVTGYLSRKTTDGVTQSVPIELVDDGNTVAFSYDNGWGGSVVVVSTLKGTGTFKTSTAGNGEIIYFANADAFTGSFDLAHKKVQIGGSEPSGDNRNWDGRLYIPSGATVTQASGATWSAANSIDIQGTLYANGTLASSHSSKAVIGAGTVVFTGRAPTPVDGENETRWWKNSSWTGTVAIKNGVIGEMTFNNYGNTDSTLELSGVTGHFTERGSTAVAPALKLTDGTGDYAFGFKSNNGWSDSACTIRKLTGSGKFMGVNNAKGNNVTQHYIVQDGSEFTGSIDLGKRSMAFGATTTKTSNKVVIDAGQSITIASGKTWTSSIGELSVDVNGTLTNSGTVTIGSANNSSAVIAIGATGSVVNNYSVSGYGAMTIADGGRFETALDNGCWFVNGITVGGTFVAAGRAKWGGDTAMVVNDTGTVVLTSTGSVSETDKDYSSITGTGVLKYSGTGYRTLPYKSGTPAKYPATTLTFENEQSDGGLVVHKTGIVIGSLKGSGNFRSDWSGASNSSQTHSLVIKQSKNTTWSGVFQNEDRLASVTVDAGDDSVVGTLTISGDQVAANESYTTASHKQDNALIVNGSVNLTGTWKGNTTVSGAFGGTGTLTGDLTFSDGATFKAFATDADGLSVSGTVTCPAAGTVTVDVSDLTLTADVALLTASNLNKDKFTLTGAPENSTLEVVEGVLTLKLPVTITVPSVANATVTVSVGGETIGTEAGTYNVAPDAVVIATYAAAEGYEISGQTVYTIDVANSETTFDPAGTTEVKQYVAQIYGGEKYTTLQAAVDAAVRNSKIIVLANETDGATIPSKDISFYIYTGAFTTGEILDATGDFITTRTTEDISISDDIHAGKVTAVKCSVAAAFMAVTIDGMRTLYGQANANDALTAANAGSIGTTVEFLSGDPASYAEYLPMFDYDSETRVYTKVANPVAAVYSGVQQLSVHRTLADAIEAAEDGQTVKLLADVTLDATIAIDKTLTLYLNVYTITASGINAITISGALTVEGSSGSVSVTSGNSVVLTSSAATLTVSGGATLSPAPTTNVVSYRVKTVTSGDTTTYSVEAIPGTTFTVY